MFRRNIYFLFLVFILGYGFMYIFPRKLIYFDFIYNSFVCFKTIVLGFRDYFIKLSG